MGLKVTNNATSILAGAITAANTELSVDVGAGGAFPTLAAGDWFPLTIVDGNGNIEILKCTARVNDLLTVTRAQEGTPAIAFAAGCRIDLRLTARAITEFLTSTDALLPANNLADIIDATSARGHLGLGTAATAGRDEFATALQGATADHAFPASQAADVATTGHYGDLTQKLGEFSLGAWSTDNWAVAATMGNGYGFQWKGTNYGHVIGYIADTFIIARNDRDALDADGAAIHDLELAPGGPLKVVGSSVLTQANIGTGANNVVATGADGKLPAVDGSKLTNTPIAGYGALGSYALVSGSVTNNATVAGSTFGYLGTWRGQGKVTDGSSTFTLIVRIA